MYETVRLQFSNFSAMQKAKMIVKLSEYPEHMETIHIVKNCLNVDGSVVLTSYEAVLLASIMYPYYPECTEYIHAHPGLKTFRRDDYEAHLKTVFDCLT